MSTPRQIDANRGNGRLSNGPKTGEGKAASSKNAMKHGLLSKDILLPEEVAEEFDDLAEGICAALRPEGRLETELIERIIALLWRLRRIGKAERAILAWHQFGVLGMDEVRRKDAEMDAKDAEMDAEDDLGEATEIDDFKLPKSSYEEAHDNAKRMAKEAGLSGAVAFGMGFSECDDSLAKMSRYETSMERSFYKALHELQRLQASRKGQPTRVPVAVDIDVMGIPGPTVAEDQHSPRE